MRIELDPRVVPYSVSASILRWDDKEVAVQARWRFIGEDQPLNLVMQINKETRELLVKDAKPAPQSFSAHIPLD